MSFTHLSDRRNFCTYCRQYNPDETQTCPELQKQKELEDKLLKEAGINEGGGPFRLKSHYSKGAKTTFLCFEDDKGKRLMSVWLKDDGDVVVKADTVGLAMALPEVLKAANESPAIEQAALHTSRDVAQVVIRRRSS